MKRSSAGGLHLPEKKMVEGFSIQSEGQLWKRFLTVQDRLVRYPDGRENAFDILGSPKIDYKVRATNPVMPSSELIAILVAYPSPVSPLRHHAVMFFTLHFRSLSRCCAAATRS